MEAPNTELLCEEWRVCRDTKCSQSGLSVWQWDESNLQVSDWTCKTSSIQCIMYLLNNEIQQLKRNDHRQGFKMEQHFWENMKEYKFDRSKGAIKWKEHYEQEWAWVKHKHIWGQACNPVGWNSTTFHFICNRIQTINGEHFDFACPAPILLSSDSSILGLL